MDKLKAWLASVDKKVLLVGIVIGLVLANLPLA